MPIYFIHFYRRGLYGASFISLPNIFPMFPIFSDLYGSINDWVHGWSYMAFLDGGDSIHGNTLLSNFPCSDGLLA